MEVAWYGVVCQPYAGTYSYDDDERLNEHGTQVSGLRLARNNLTGYMPTEIGMLSKTVTSSVNFNFNPVAGTIPTELGRLTRLSFNVALQWTSISGFIPTQLGRLTAMRQVFSLEDMRVSGTLPTELGELFPTPNKARPSARDDRPSMAFGSAGALSGTLPSEFGRLTALKVLSIRAARYSGSLPTEFGRLTLTVLQASNIKLSMPTSIREVRAFHLATPYCGTAKASCTGFPPLGCTAFGQEFRPSIVPSKASHLGCVDCSTSFIQAAFLAGLLLLLLMLFFAYVINVAIRKASRMAMCTILLTHLQAFGILSGLPLWPSSIQEVLIVLNLDVFGIPKISCLLPALDNTGGRGENQVTLPATTQINVWLFGYCACGLSLLLLLYLSARVAISTRTARDNEHRQQASDKLELVLSVVFGVPLVCMWRASLALLNLSNSALTDAKTMREPGYLHAVGHASANLYLDSAKQLESLACAGITLGYGLLVVQVCLAIHFARRLSAMASIRRAPSVIVGVDALPPLRLRRRLRYFSERFRADKPHHELVLWLWLAVLQAISEALRHVHQIWAHQPSADSAANYALLVLLIMVDVAMLAHHEITQPYSRQLHNQLARRLFQLQITLLSLGILYLMLAEIESASHALTTALEWLIFGLFVGSIFLALVVVFRDMRNIKTSTNSIDVAQAIFRIDADAIDRPLRERLSDGTILLLRCDWLAATDCERYLKRPDGTLVLQRRQDLPAFAFVQPHVAARMLDQANRSVLVLSHGWMSPLHPDPKGVTLSAVRRYLQQHANVAGCGLFVDYSSLPQKDEQGNNRSIRCDEKGRSETSIFADGLAVMGSCYASLCGTTVLVQKYIPADVENARDYNSRGWCTFESGLAMIVEDFITSAATRCQLPTSVMEAEAARPKSVDITTLAAADENGLHQPPKALDLGAGTATEQIKVVTAAMLASTFTGKGDKDKVRAMLLRFEWIIFTAFEHAEQVADGEMLTVHRTKWKAVSDTWKAAKKLTSLKHGKEVKAAEPHEDGPGEVELPDIRLLAHDRA